VDRRTLNWPAIITSTVLLAAVVVLAARPGLLAPLVTHLLNRQLLSKIDGELRVQEYHLRPFQGLDLVNVSVNLPGDRGGHTLVAVDTLALDFRIRELVGPRPRLRRAQLTGVEVFHNQDAPAAEPSTGEFTPPRVAVDLLWIENAEVEVSGPDGRLRERIADVSWRGAIAGDRDSLQVRCRLARADWTTRDARLRRIRGDVTVTPDGIRVRGLTGKLNDGRFAVDGFADLAGDLRLDVAGTGLSTHEVSLLTGVDLDFAATGAIEAVITKTGDTVVLDGRDFDGVIEGFALQDVHGQAVIVPGEVRFDRVQGEVSGARYDGSLVLDTDAPGGTDVLLEGEAAQVDLSTGLIPEAEDLPRTWGHGRLRVQHTAATEWTDVTGTLLDGEIAIMPFDTCRIDVSAREDSLIFHAVDLSYRSLRARFAGTSDRREIVAGEAAVRADDLRDLPRPWGFPPQLGGAFSGTVQVAGPLTDLRVAGPTTLTDVALGPLTVAAGQGHVAAERILGEDWHLTADLAGGGLALGGVPLGQYALAAGVGPTAVVVDTFRAQHGDTVVSFRGRADLVGGEADIWLQRARIEFADNVWRTPGPLSARVGPHRAIVPDVRLVSRQGTLSGRLRLEAGPIDGELRLDNFDLRLIEPFVPAARGVGGTVTADATVGGTSDAPVVTASGQLRDADFPLARVDTLTVGGQYREGAVHVDSLTVASEFGHVALSGTVAHPGATVAEFWPGADLDLDVAIRGGDWAFLEPFAIPALDRLAGVVDGELQVSGRTDSPVVAGQLDSRDFRIHWLRLERLTGEIYADHQLLVLGNLAGHHGALALRGRVEVPVDLDFLSTPETPLDGPFYARLVVPDSTDLAPLTEATGAFIRASGRGSGEVIISGPLDHPLWQGDLSVDDAGFVITQTQEVYHDVRVRGHFHGDDLILTEVTGKEGLTGTFRGDGFVRFRGLEMETYQLDLQMDEFLLASVPDMRALLKSSNAGITGVAVGPDSVLVPKFTGDYELILGRYTGTFQGAGEGEDPTLATVAPAWLADVRVTGGTRTARIVNQNMDLDMSGDVTLIRDESGLLLRGSMNIDAGRLPVFANTFNVVRGTLDFSQAVGLVPRVDLVADTRIRLRSPRTGASTVERITVHVTGTLAEPEIAYSSESGYPREAVERMLLGLSPYPDEQGDDAALANTSLGAGLNLVERELARGIKFVDTVELEHVSGQQAGDAQFNPLVGVGKYVRILGGERYDNRRRL